MLECQPAEVQQLLLRTSLLDRVNGELADLLTGHPGSEGILLDLEDASAFVVSLDPARTWFRYHHLFADLLRLELRRRLPGQLPALHRLAAGWLSEHGEIVDAIRHTQAAGDWSDAARLLADHSFGLTLDGQAQTIQTLLQAFPPGAVIEGPDIPLARATSELVVAARGPRVSVAGEVLDVAERRACVQQLGDGGRPEGVRGQLAGLGDASALTEQDDYGSRICSVRSIDTPIGRAREIQSVVDSTAGRRSTDGQTIFGAFPPIHDKPLNCTYGRDARIRTGGLVLPNQLQPVAGRSLT
jgi:hypothetical protein